MEAFVAPIITAAVKTFDANYFSEGDFVTFGDTTITDSLESNLKQRLVESVDRCLYDNPDTCTKLLDVATKKRIKLQRASKKAKKPVVDVPAKLAPKEITCSSLEEYCDIVTIDPDDEHLAVILGTTLEEARAVEEKASRNLEQSKAFLGHMPQRLEDVHTALRTYLLAVHAKAIYQLMSDGKEEEEEDDPSWEKVVTSAHKDNGRPLTKATHTSNFFSMLPEDDSENGAVDSAATFTTADAPSGRGAGSKKAKSSEKKASVGATIPMEPRECGSVSVNSASLLLDSATAAGGQLVQRIATIRWAQPKLADLMDPKPWLTLLVFSLGLDEAHRLFLSFVHRLAVGGSHSGKLSFSFWWLTLVCIMVLAGMAIERTYIGVRSCIHFLQAMNKRHEAQKKRSGRVDITSAGIEKAGKKNKDKRVGRA